MGKLFKRGDTYYADLRAEGRGKVSLRTSDRTVAKARLRRAELGPAGEGAHPPKALAQAIDDMLATKAWGPTATSYRLKSLHLLRVLGVHADINQLSHDDVADYAAGRLKEGAARHTVHKELVVLRQTLKEAKRRRTFAGDLGIVPAWRDGYVPRKRWASEKEFRRIFAAAPIEHRTRLMLHAYAGASKGEVERMGWEHVHEDAITVPGTKTTGRHRIVPLHPELAAWLDGLDRGAPLVAPWRKVNRDLRAICKALGIVPNVTPHDLRRTFGSWLKQAGVDSLHVAHLMGHKSTTMVDRVYGQLSPASYAAAIAALPSVISRPTGVPAPRKLPKQRGRHEP